MNILIACQSFNFCSGTSMYVHDLALELKARGNDVTILSDLGGEIANSAIKAGIKVVDFSQIFTIQDVKFDVMHLNGIHASDMALEFFPNVPAVVTIHSELQAVDQPYVHPGIRSYIAVRPEIANRYLSLAPIVIPDGIDFSRFNTKRAAEIQAKKGEVGMKKEIRAFDGGINSLSSISLRDTMDGMEEGNYDLWVIGRSFLPFVLPAPIQMLAETFFIEKWVEMADLIVGIKIGRSAIEAWACGKPYLCYDIDDRGKILNKVKIDPPEDMTQYDIVNVTDQILTVYIHAMNAGVANA